MYELIGRAAVRGLIPTVRVRYGRRLRLALGFGALAALIGGYLAATRTSAPEG
jgi:hypothetical protein